MGACEMGEMAYHNLRNLNEPPPGLLLEALDELVEKFTEIMVKAGRVDRAHEVAKIAHELSKGLKSIKDRVEIVRVIEQSAEGRRSWTEAIHYKTMPRIYEEMVYKIADMLIETKKFEKVKELAERIDKREYVIRAGILIKLATALKEAGMEEEA